MTGHKLNIKVGRHLPILYQEPVREQHRKNKKSEISGLHCSLQQHFLREVPGNRRFDKFQVTVLAPALSIVAPRTLFPSHCAQCEEGTSPRPAPVAPLPGLAPSEPVLFRQLEG